MAWQCGSSVTFLDSRTQNSNGVNQKKAVLEAVLIEFDHLCGAHGTKTGIHGFAFADEYERDFLARMITRAFLAHDLCYGRSYGFAYGKAVLLPRDR